jgi:class 3 adenylate cyclase
MKPLGTTILCSQVFHQNLPHPSLPHAFEDLGEIKLKGKLRPVHVFGVKEKQ